MESQSQQHRGTKRGPGRPRGSSRAGRPSSSSGNHHPYNASPTSLTNIINFGNSPSSIHARSPSSSRGRVRAANNTTPAHPNITPAPADTGSNTTPAMGLNHIRAAPRSEKAPKQTLTHSFTFSTPQNPRNTPGRKRARTLEYPTDSAAARDDAKVKGGHSLRKRARIDYAQMNDENEEDQPFKEIAEDQTEITVSGVRSARKRRSTVDPKYEEEEGQPSVNPATKRPKAEKQRTVSPKPQRRKPQQRKSTSVTTRPQMESPEQQPSDTELKDTIEVGAPLAMHFTGSSSSQHSETASNVSGQSPSRNHKIQQPIIIKTQVASPTSMQLENDAATDSEAKGKSTQLASKNAQSPLVKQLSHTEVADNAPADLDGKDNLNQQDHGPQVTRDFSSVSEIDNSQVVTPSAQDQAPEVFRSSMVTNSHPGSSQCEDQPSSQETVDSDATVDMPPDRPVITSALATQLRNTISSVAEEQSTDRQRRVSQPDMSKQLAIEPRQEELQDSQETSNLIPRTRVCLLAMRAGLCFDYHVVANKSIYRDARAAYLKLPWLKKNPPNWSKRKRKLQPQAK